MTKAGMSCLAKRLLGLGCLCIGLWLAKNLVTGFLDLYQSAQSQRDMKFLFSMAVCALMLIIGGGALAYDPDLLNE